MKRCLPIFLLLLSASAHGALNKWVDAEGNVHYSDEPPPPNVKAQTLTTPSATGDEPVQKTIAEREAERKKAQKAKEEAAQKDAKQQEEILSRQKYCEALRASLSTLEKNIALYLTNDKGENVLMDAATRQRQLETARKEIGANCSQAR